MLEYKGMSKVRMTALKILVSMMEKKDIEPMRQVFLEMDEDRSGFVLTSELKEAMHKGNF